MSPLVENYAGELLYLVLVTEDLLLVKINAGDLLYLVLVAEDLLLVESDAGDFFDPVLVVGHPHVDSGQVGVGTLDTVTNCPHQYPPKINQCVIIIVFKPKWTIKNNIIPDRVADPDPVQDRH
jgi:hypothetical protein